MKAVISILILLSAIPFILISCSDNTEKQPALMPDRFPGQFHDITEIADIKRLTEVKRDMAPFFSPSGDRIYFSRLIITNSNDVDSDLAESIEHYFSLDYKNNQLYIIEGIPPYPEIETLPADSLPHMMTESPVFGIRAGNRLYFTTEGNPNELMRNIYESLDDSLVQLTYGTESSFLQLLSPDDRYVVFLYDRNHSSIVLYDSQTGKYYEVPKSKAEEKRHDFGPMFSPDGKYMVFLRSGDLYKSGVIPFGDIWLAEFKQGYY